MKISEHLDEPLTLKHAVSNAYAFELAIDHPCSQVFEWGKVNLVSPVVESTRKLELSNGDGGVINAMSWSDGIYFLT